MVIELKLADYLEMVRHARALAPIEDCGLLGGTVADGVKTVEKVYYLTNTDHSEEHFSLDPKEQFAAVKEMRAKGWQLLAREQTVRGAEVDRECSLHFFVCLDGLVKIPTRERTP